MGIQVQCRAVLRSGVQCGREAAASAELCAYHRALEFRGRARAFLLARLSAEELRALADASRVEGMDGEIAVLRVLLRKVWHTGDIDAFRRGLETLCRLVQFKHQLDRQAKARLSSQLEAALEMLGASAPPLDRLPNPQPPFSGALARELAEEGQEARRWQAALKASPAAAQEPPEEREAAALALRYQAGHADALDPLYRQLRVAILAVLLHYRALQLPPATPLDELHERSRTVLAALARRWRPGVSFLGYFFRTFPDAIARHLHRARASIGEAPSKLPVPLRQRALPAPTPQSALPNPLPALPELERRVLVLRALEGQSLHSVARQVGVPVGRASKLYGRARGRLEGPTRLPEGPSSIAMRRLVRALHLTAGPRGQLPNRAWAMAAAGLKRGEYDRLMGQLEGAGAIRRGRRSSGYFADRDAAATLARLGLGSTHGASEPGGTSVGDFLQHHVP